MRNLCDVNYRKPSLVLDYLMVVITQLTLIDEQCNTGTVFQWGHIICPTLC